MPGLKDPFLRYRVLDELLSNHYKQYSITDLIEEVNNRLCELNPDSDGVTRRCIEKDLRYIESTFGIEIERYNVVSTNSRTGRDYSKQCLRYADFSFSIFKKKLSNDEVYLLREALSMLGRFDRLPGLEGLEGLRLSLKMTPGFDNGNIISTSRNPLEDSNLLGRLFTAISRRQVIDVRYRKFGPEVEGRVFRVNPYLLKEYNRRWFLICATFDTGFILTLALDRILDVVEQPSLKYVPYDGDINHRYDNTIGVTIREDAPVHRIVFWAENSVCDYVTTKPLIANQTPIIDDEEMELRREYSHLEQGAFFAINCQMTHEAIKELCSYGSGIVVLSPAEVVQQIATHCRLMNEAYQTVIAKK